MTRREILKYTAYATGAALSAPLASAIMSGCTAEPAAPGFVPDFFSAESFPDLSVMLEVMLPATSTPGAIELGVPTFVDRVMHGYTKPKMQKKVLEGFSAWSKEVTSEEGKPFYQLDGAQQLAVLSKLNASSIAAQAEIDKTKDQMTNDEKYLKQPWWLVVKSTAIAGYFSSEHIGLEVLNYNPVPGPYQGCVPLEEVGQQWSL